MKIILPRLLVALLFFSPVAAPAVPTTIGFSARVADNGRPVSGTHAFGFKFFDALEAGTELWKHSATDEPAMLVVNDGVVSYALGSDQAINLGVVFNGLPVFVEVTFNGAVLSPRVEVHSVPYAIRAQVAESMPWPVPMTLQFTPTVPTAGCAVPAAGGATFGSTISTSPMTIGLMYFNQAATLAPGLKSSFTRGRLVVLCRGNGTIAVVTEGCTQTVATIACSGGTRPWTAASAEFTLPGYADYNLQATAITGTLEWANPQLVLY
jgi:hypothetical protein